MVRMNHHPNIATTGAPITSVSQITSTASKDPLILRQQIKYILQLSETLHHEAFHAYLTLVQPYTGVMRRLKEAGELDALESRQVSAFSYRGEARCHRRRDVQLTFCAGISVRYTRGDTVLFVPGAVF